MWKETVLLHLGWMDINYAIRKDEPPVVTNTSTEAKITLYEHWERSNRLSVMFIKTKISADIRGSVDQHIKVRDLLKAIDEQFVTSDKALASTPNYEVLFQKARYCERPLRIFYDNSAVVFMAKNNKSGSQSKHIDIKYLAIRERVNEGKVVIEHVNTELMIVDPLTKGMPPSKFKDHVMSTGLNSIM
ncbi:hypothetical protein F0562_019872 [Nyssa sinensis]|uniref:Copia protein n=1 Tax=Nyssa sinensis TaxID=561372 RepID=A0A5J5BQF8_9ASTE|nr:hypothetical protein F0562_019872 [Nyssa sinensis]